MLSSMVKSLDVASYTALMAAKDGTWKPGPKQLGLKEKGVYWADDQYNKSLITDKIRVKLTQVEKDIIDGKIKIVDYMKANKCEYSFKE